MKRLYYLFIALSFCACARPLSWDVETNANGPFTERLIAVLDAGLLTNPASIGTYNGTGVFTSVDPG